MGGFSPPSLSPGKQSCVLEAAFACPHWELLQSRCDNSRCQGVVTSLLGLSHAPRVNIHLVNYPHRDWHGVTWGAWGQCAVLGDASQRNKTFTGGAENPC